MATGMTTTASTREDTSVNEEVRPFFLIHRQKATFRVSIHVGKSGPFFSFLFQETHQSLPRPTTVTTLHQNAPGTHQSPIFASDSPPPSSQRRFHDGVGVSGHLGRPPLSRGKRHQHPVGFLRAQERRHLSAAGRNRRWSVASLANRNVGIRTNRTAGCAAGSCTVEGILPGYRKMCDNRPFCFAYAHAENDPCPDVSKYLEIVYSCEQKGGGGPPSRAASHLETCLKAPASPVSHSVSPRPGRRGRQRHQLPALRLLLHRRLHSR